VENNPESQAAQNKEESNEPIAPIEPTKEPKKPLKAAKKRQIRYRPKNRGQRYTPIEKLSVAALLKAGKKPAEISRELGISKPTIYNVKRDEKYQIIEQSKVDDIKRSLIGMTYSQAHRAQSFISDEKLEASSALQLMTISAIGIDKGRLMEGLATEIVGSQKEDSELDLELNSKRDELNRLRNAKFVNAEVIASNQPGDMKQVDNQAG